MDGKVEKATAVMNIWLLADNSTGPTANNKDAMDWENGFINITVDNPPSDPPDNLKMFSLAERSYDDEIMFVMIYFLAAKETSHDCQAINMRKIFSNR